MAGALLGLSSVWTREDGRTSSARLCGSQACDTWQDPVWCTEPGAGASTHVPSRVPERLWPPRRLSTVTPSRCRPGPPLLREPLLRAPPASPRHHVGLFNNLSGVGCLWGCAGNVLASLSSSGLARWSLRSPRLWAFSSVLTANIKMKLRQEELTACQGDRWRRPAWGPQGAGAGPSGGSVPTSTPLSL